MSNNNNNSEYDDEEFPIIMYVREPNMDDQIGLVTTYTGFLEDVEDETVQEWIYEKFIRYLNEEELLLNDGRQLQGINEDTGITNWNLDKFLEIYYPNDSEDSNFFIQISYVAYDENEEQGWYFFEDKIIKKWLEEWIGITTEDIIEDDEKQEQEEEEEYYNENNNDINTDSDSEYYNSNLE